MLYNGNDNGAINIIKMAHKIVKCLTLGVRKRYGTGTGGCDASRSTSNFSIVARRNWRRTKPHSNSKESSNSVCRNTYTSIILYCLRGHTKYKLIRRKTVHCTQCVRKNLPYFGRMFLRLIYINITKPNHIQSQRVAETTRYTARCIRDTNNVSITSKTNNSVEKV